jgi:CubicO group peptidase (beta-lactamase class C family)
MKSFYLLLFCFISIIAIPAQEPENSPLVQNIDSFIHRSITDHTPGGAVAIVSGEKVIYQKTFGMMSMEYQLPNTNHTLFNLASVSKHFTAYCILLLEKEGKINLDEDIRHYLPNLPDYGEVVTVRELVHHTSGIPSSDNLKLFAGVPFESPWDADDEMEIISRYKQLNYKPNDERNYSNSGYFLLARIIEKVSGQSFSDYITQNVFRPLGMSETFVYDRPGKVFPGKASGYKKADSDYIRMNTDGESVYGSTNLYTSLNDITRWMQYLLNLKGTDAGLVKMLFYPSSTNNAGDSIYYSYGLNLRRYKGIKTADHGGYAMGFRSQIMYFPEDNLAIVTMCNNESIDNWNLLTKVADIYFHDRLIPEKSKERKEIRLPGDILKNYAGTYRMSDGRRFNFELNNDTLLVSIPGEPKYMMHAESETQFYVKEFNAQCSFEIGSTGKCDEIQWQENNWRPKGKRLDSQLNLSALALKKYTGDYFNAPLDVTYSVKFNGDKLTMEIPKTFHTYFGMDRDIFLDYIEKDRFYTEELGIVEFTRDSNRVINGFNIVDFGRVRNVKFRKD